MSPREKVLVKLKDLERYVGLLKKYQKLPLKKIENDPTILGAVERYMQVSIECVIDIGELLISMKNFKKPETYREIIEILSKEGILTKSFAERFAPAIGLRNILVHAYADVKVDELYQNLKYSLGDFEKFACQVASHLKDK